MTLRRIAVAAALVLSLAGCAKNYVITQPLAQPLTTPMAIAVGSIEDQLPVDMPPEKRPKADDFATLKRYLVEEIVKAEIASMASQDSAGARWMVEGALLNYKRGNGAVRFFIGFGVGNAKTTVELKLIDRQTGSSVFSGNFYGQVSSWAEGGDQMFRRVAKDFAKALKKQLKETPPRS